MKFGDGDGKIFADFTNSIDVIAHELTYGVTQFTAALRYHDQPGALNYFISDVLQTLVKQKSRNELPQEADWLIGAEIVLVGGALRSMKEPGMPTTTNIWARTRNPII